MSDVISSQLAAIPPQQCNWNGRNTQTHQHETDAQWQSMVQVPAVPALHCHVGQPVPMTPSCLQPPPHASDRQPLSAPAHTLDREREPASAHTSDRGRVSAKSCSQQSWACPIWCALLKVYTHDHFSTHACAYM